MREQSSFLSLEDRRGATVPESLWHRGSSLSVSLGPGGEPLRGEPQREPHEVGGVGMCLTLGLVCFVSFISAWAEGYPELGTQVGDRRVLDKRQ